MGNILLFINFISLFLHPFPNYSERTGFFCFCFCILKSALYCFHCMFKLGNPSFHLNGICLNVVCHLFSEYRIPTPFLRIQLRHFVSCYILLVYNCFTWVCSFWIPKCPFYFAQMFRVLFKSLVLLFYSLSFGFTVTLSSSNTKIWDGFYVRNFLVPENGKVKLSLFAVAIFC